MRLIAITCCLATLALTTTARADVDIDQRCSHELHSRRETSWIGITPELTTERHLWALRCGYISQALVDVAEGEKMVWSFVDLEGKEKIAPWNRDAPCGRYVRTNMCQQGCFAADQEIQFDDGMLTLEEAAARGVDSFMSLAPGSSMLSLEFQPGEKIRRYTAGLEEAELVELTLDSGQQLRVTSNHAMVGGSGELLPAREIEVGSSLLTTDGAHFVTHVSHARDSRRVWHIVPTSSDPTSNIMIAQGVLTGSSRFQQMWADEMTRNVLRTNLEKSTVEAFEQE